MSEANELTEVEVKWGDKSARARSRYISELIASVSLVGLAGLAILLLRHQEITDTHQREAKEINKQVVQAIRMQTCLISLPESERKTEYAAPYGFCKTLSNPAPGVW